MKTIIENPFKKRKQVKLYTIVATDKMLDFLKENQPSGGWFREFCMNSDLFRNRTCPVDKKKYKKGYKCPCFI